MEKAGKGQRRELAGRQTGRLDSVADPGVWHWVCWLVLARSRRPVVSAAGSIPGAN